MTPEALRAALDQLDSRRAVDEVRFGEDRLREVAELPRAAVALAGDADPARAAKARSLVARLGEFAAGALLEVERSAGPQDDVWRLATATAGVVELRGRVAARLAQALDDRRPVPLVPDVFPSEEKPAPRRVCDEAYLLLRELSSVGESRGALVLKARAFLRRPDPDRDAEIARARSGLPFTRLFEDADA